MLKVINFRKFIKESFDKKYTNKFNFVLGKAYEYDELPKEVQDDIDVQFDEFNYDEGPCDYKWKFKLMKPEEIEKYVTGFFGQYLDEAIEKDYMQKLIKDIKKRGLDWPAIGTEGNHRALACWHLGLPLPYLDPIYKY